jgi:hypothetical protein
MFVLNKRRAKVQKIRQKIEQTARYYLYIFMYHLFPNKNAPGEARKTGAGGVCE